MFDVGCSTFIKKELSGLFRLGFCNYPVNDPHFTTSLYALTIMTG